MLLSLLDLIEQAVFILCKGAMGILHETYVSSFDSHRPEIFTAILGYFVATSSEIIQVACNHGGLVDFA